MILDSACGKTVLREKSKHSDLSLQEIIEIKYEDN